MKQEDDTLFNYISLQTQSKSKWVRPSVIHELLRAIRTSSQNHLYK